jgi:hypothetical protein
MARPKNATENIVTPIIPEWVIHVPGPKHCRENVTDEKRPKNGPEPATAMVKELVPKMVPSHSVAKPITVEWVVVEVFEAVDLMETSTG